MSPRPIATLLILFLYLTTFSIDSDASIVSVKVSDQIIILETADPARERKHPSCVNLEGENKWTASLLTDSGRAIYTLAMLAINQHKTLTIETSGDCGDIEGIERAASAHVAIQQNQPLTSKATYPGLFKGDGKTLVGRIISFEPRSDTFYFLTNEPATRPQFYAHPKVEYVSNMITHYAERECKGKAYLPSNRIFFDGIRFYKGGEHKTNLLSRRSNGKCYSIKGDGYLLEEAEHPICGEKPCVARMTE
ncbi:hypothetical protein OE749_06430 [Aestuariibacter sp. AA17]|uniref:Uncharacterized protein n=1 Tax=Fluctibacter corallii TaxID=2984329 RepID=A0ABT3A7N3_9ALTE|nr:hypothetical protein [Aestuariibacter sp. AA17]MCV2884326.1 hypothetical protein [Aestuariibacter sp. AA17]